MKQRAAAPLPAAATPAPRRRSLRIFDQETARVVAVHRASGEIVGAGCLVDADLVITCRHVVEAALAGNGQGERTVFVSLPGVEGQPTVRAIANMAGGGGPENDIAALSILDELDLAVQPVEFVSPIRHGGKRYSVLGFPGGDRQGRNAAGFLHAADARGLVQMDRGSSLLVLGGFSGAPVWSADVGGFVGLVVTELADAEVAWCIPSRILCQFHPELLVRFRVPPADRPQIHDYELDDPNVQTFGTNTDNGERRLSARVRHNEDPDRDEDFKAIVTYECLPGSPRPRGGYVTFITHPSYTNENEDAYELFARLQPDPKAPGRLVAEAIFYPEESFTVAAVGDGGDTALTFDLRRTPKKPRNFE